MFYPYGGKPSLLLNQTKYVSNVLYYYPCNDLMPTNIVMIGERSQDKPLHQTLLLKSFTKYGSGLWSEIYCVELCYLLARSKSVRCAGHWAGL